MSAAFRFSRAAEFRLQDRPGHPVFAVSRASTVDKAPLALPVRRVRRAQSGSRDWQATQDSRETEDSQDCPGRKANPALLPTRGRKETQVSLEEMDSMDPSDCRGQKAIPDRKEIKVCLVLAARVCLEIPAYQDLLVLLGKSA